jgi:hypothetical protein
MIQEPAFQGQMIVLSWGHRVLVPRCIHAARNPWSQGWLLVLVSYLRDDDELHPLAKAIT